MGVLYYIGVLFALIGAVGVGLMLGGFFSGLSQLIYLNGNEEFLPGHRYRAIWGAMLAWFAFVSWEIIHTLAGWVLTGEGVSIGWWFLGIILALLVLGWLVKLFKGGGGAH